MKNLTDFRKTVETGVDPRPHTKEISAYARGYCLLITQS